jgi:hypothetical protein
MNRTKVFTAAHASIKASNFTKSWSLCLIESYTAERKRMQHRTDIVNQFKTGVVCFRFKKESDGTERFAVGTLDSRFFSYEGKSSSAKDVENVRYFDLQKGGWRMFKLDNFIGFCELEYPTDFIVKSAISYAVTAEVNMQNGEHKLHVLCQVGCCDEDLFTISLNEAAKHGVDADTLQNAKAFIEAMLKNV